MEYDLTQTYSQELAEKRRDAMADAAKTVRENTVHSGPFAVAAYRLSESGPWYFSGQHVALSPTDSVTWKWSKSLLDATLIHDCETADMLREWADRWYSLSGDSRRFLFFVAPVKSS